MDRPIIGLNADYRPARDDAPAATVIDAGYYEAISAAGGVPVVIPPLAGRLRDVLDRLDGIVLVGGNDLDPRNDGYMLGPRARLMDARREGFDRQLVGQVADRLLPVFAIGAGMQLLNVAMGGTLFLHLPEDVPDAMPHFDPTDPGHRHALEVEPESLMERVYGESQACVTSSHHMAVDDLGAGLCVTGRSPDGIVEAVESTTNDWFVLGTQFHPESPAAPALDLGIFEEFVRAVTGAARPKEVRRRSRKKKPG